MNNNSFLPVILGADENAYACARSFFEGYGVKSYLLCSSPLAVTSYSKILTRKVIPDLDISEVFSQIVPKILDSLKQFYGKLILIPCSDYYTELCVNHSEKIQDLIENNIISKKTLSLFSDKSAFLKLTEVFGLPHPETLISSPLKLSSSDISFNFPIVLKPENSNSSEYLHAKIKNKKKVYFCKDRAELDEVLQNFRDCGLDQNVIIQRFISGGTDCLFTVNAYCDKNARVRLIGAAQAVIECKDSLSFGNYIALRPIADRKLCDRCAEILEKLNYCGFANFDIKKDPETGRYFFLELNPRQGRSSYCIHTAGKELMSEIVDDIIFKKTFEGRKYAEKNGLWSTLPLCFVKKSLPFELQATKDIDYALDFKADRSLLRSVKLAKRNFTIAKKNGLKI